VGKSSSEKRRPSNTQGVQDREYTLQVEWLQLTTSASRKGGSGTHSLRGWPCRGDNSCPDIGGGGGQKQKTFTEMSLQEKERCWSRLGGTSM